MRLFVEEATMAKGTLEEAFSIAFSRKAKVTKTDAMPIGSSMGTVYVDSPVPAACGIWDWKLAHNGFWFIREF